MKSCNAINCTEYNTNVSMNCKSKWYNCEYFKELNAEKDEVNHPSHYTSSKIESIDIIADVTGEHFEGFLVGNCLKYLHRYRNKNGVTDLKKCRWYLDKLIEVLENEKKE